MTVIGEELAGIATETTAILGESTAILGETTAILAECTAITPLVAAIAAEIPLLLPAIEPLLISINTAVQSIAGEVGDLESIKSAINDIIGIIQSILTTNNSINNNTSVISTNVSQSLVLLNTLLTNLSSNHVEVINKFDELISTVQIKTNMLNSTIITQTDKIYNSVDTLDKNNNDRTKVLEDAINSVVYYTKSTTSNLDDTNAILRTHTDLLQQLVDK